MSIFTYNLTTLTGEHIALSRFAGQVLLLSNTASECGFTGQYAALEALHRQYRDQGLTVIGFPCNQFGRQEPGDADAIGSFCQKNFGTSFLLSEKIDVNGAQAHPLWQYLCRQNRGLLGSKAIKWNFSKFLVNRDGDIVGRYGPLTRPEALRGEIERWLATPAAQSSLTSPSR